MQPSSGPPRRAADESCLLEFDEFHGHDERDGDEVVVEDDEGQDVLDKALGWERESEKDRGKLRGTHPGHRWTLSPANTIVGSRRTTIECFLRWPSRWKEPAGR